MELSCLFISMTKRNKKPQIRRSWRIFDYNLECRTKDRSVSDGRFMYGKEKINQNKTCSWLNELQPKIIPTTSRFFLIFMAFPELFYVSGPYVPRMKLLVSSCDFTTLGVT